MNNNEVRYLLEAIFASAVRPYPFPKGSEVDPRYAMALGFVAGAASEGLHAVAENRPMRLTNIVTDLAHHATKGDK